MQKTGGKDAKKKGKDAKKRGKDAKKKGKDAKKRGKDAKKKGKDAKKREKDAKGLIFIFNFSAQNASGKSTTSNTVRIRHNGDNIRCYE